MVSESNPLLVDVRHLNKQKGGNKILQDISLEIAPGKVVCLLGPSGAGKSTLLRCMNAIEHADSGVVYIDGDPIGCKERDGVMTRLPESRIAAQRAMIGMVFQNFNLFPHMSVLDNIINAPIRVKGVARAEAIETATRLLAGVGLVEMIDRYPSQLSGGQQQRIAIVRALAMAPKLMLFDEPTSALDPHITDEVLDVLKDLAASGMTMVIVTHEISFARDVSDEVIIMAEGRIIERGPSAQVLSNPSHPVTRRFLAKTIAQPMAAAA